MARDVCPRKAWSSLYQTGRREESPSVETAYDIQILEAMFRHEPITMPGETAGIGIAKVQLQKERRTPIAYLTQNVSLDRLFDMLLNLKDNQKWFFQPRIHQEGYKDQPWSHFMPYDIIFDCQWRNVGTDDEEPYFETYTLGITDKLYKLPRGSGICCMLYLQGPEDGNEERNREEMNRLLVQLDEALIHPYAMCALRYSDGSKRMWGKGSQKILI